MGKCQDWACTHSKAPRRGRKLNSCLAHKDLFSRWLEAQKCLGRLQVCVTKGPNMSPHTSFQQKCVKLAQRSYVIVQFTEAQMWLSTLLKFRCDCPVYWSSPNICQHALAAAEGLGILAKFLQWVHKTKKSSNLSLLIADSVHKTVGEKSTTRRKGAPKKKQNDKQDLPILLHHHPLSIATILLSNPLHGVMSTPLPLQAGPCTVGFQMQSPV